MLRTAGDRATAVVVCGGEPIDLPPDMLKTLQKGVQGLASETEAADLLGLSRPYLTRLLKAGKLPYRKKGNRHLVPVGALRDFRANRNRQLDRLVDAEDDLGPR